jgi:hypothetical protein
VVSYGTLGLFGALRVVWPSERCGRLGGSTYDGKEVPALTSKLLTNPQYWRDRAEEIQAIADRLANQETKRTMQDLATCYEQLARRAEERLSASEPGI